jgi:glyoxylase-like metal-dependent hydrolase (beta-lactamase superfamily II)
MRQAGVEGEMLDAMLHVSAEIRARTAPHPPAFQCVGVGDILTLGARRFEVIIGAGHSMAQVMLYDAADRLLFCADHVLMKITPNVGIWPGSDADPLAHFIESLRQLATLPVRLALPGHRTVITDWAGRLHELLHHHDERLALMHEAAGDGATVLDIAQRVFDFRQFTAHEMRFAVAETLAHLEYLRARGQVMRTEALPWVYRRQMTN